MGEKVAVPETRISTTLRSCRLPIGCCGAERPADLRHAQRHAEPDGDIEIVGGEVDDEEQDRRGEVGRQHAAGLQQVLHAMLRRCR